MSNKVDTSSIFIRKKNGSTEPYDESKVKRAIKLASNRAPKGFSLDDEYINSVVYPHIESFIEPYVVMEDPKILDVSDMHNIVTRALSDHSYEVSNQYRTYQNYKKSLDDYDNMVETAIMDVVDKQLPNDYLELARKSVNNAMSKLPNDPYTISALNAVIQEAIRNSDEIIIKLLSTTSGINLLLSLIVFEYNMDGGVELDEY